MDEKSFQELKNRSLYAKLKRLFSNDVIVRNIGGKKLKVIDTDEIFYATDRNSLRDRFNRLRTTAYNQYTRDFNLSYQSSRVELFRDYDCVGPDTVIPLPDGTTPTIAELTEKYKDKPQERFYVFSYDHETNSIKLGKAYHPRKKNGKRQGYKVTFDSGQYVIASLKHPFMMRDGSYKRTFELRVGDSVMPFYQKEYGYNKHGFKRYRRLYNFSKGWQSEHKIVAEQFYRKMEKNEVIHHLDINGSNNSPDNLLILDWKEHKKYHNEYNKNVLWSDENYEKQLSKLKSHPNYINRNFHHWNGERVGKNNPFYGKSHSDESNEKRSYTLKEVFKNRDQGGEKNPKYRSDITFENVKEKAYEYYKEYSKINLWEFIDHINCDHSTLQNRLKKQGHDWKSFKQDIVSTLNHKIVSIEQVGEIDVYDVTVEKYENFATDSCFVSNTMDMDPILASALDIYADECTTRNELGEVITIHSSNDDIKSVLNNLFYDILNIEFNLWSWTRSLAKYGDFYLRMHISPEYGVYMVEPLSSYYVTRVENSHSTNKNFTKFQVNLPYGNKIEDLENYQMAHFRLINDSNFLPYGKSMLEGARRVWKQLSLMEDAMLIHRIMRAPEKRIFKVDIGNIPPNEVDNHMERIIQQMKKTPYLDQNTGDYNLRFNLQNMVEDFFLPVRGGDSGTSIDNLPGLEWTGTDDIEYLRNKMMAALKIPKAFLGYDESLCVSPETKIPLLNGEEKTVKQLIDDHTDGIKNYVYSIDEQTNNIVPGEIEWAGYTRKNADVVRVWLDNGKYIDCTPDHKFMTRNGEWVDAINLVPEQALMPLYTKKSTRKDRNGYEMVYHPSTGKYQEVHRLVAEHYNKIHTGSGKVVHHKDFNKLNNYPDNLIGNKRYNAKYSRITLDTLISAANNSSSFKELETLLGIEDRRTLNKLFESHAINNKLEFIINHMPKSISNRSFMNNYGGIYKNHTVVRVEILSEKIDTCDITIKHYHNFATSAGVIIHNSGKATLAAEDIRFARTIQRVQRIIVSELNKIAVVHLYSQGYRDEALVDFNLELTNPSTIFEKEKIDVWKSKVEVSKDMQEQKLFSKKWIYDNVFGMSDQDMIVLQKELVDDAKGMYRFKQIEEEGNDPALEFLKAKGDGEAGGEGGGGDAGGDESGGSSGGDESGGESAGGADAGAAPTGGEAPKLTERDQTGRKKARNYPFGEDPLGTLELNSRSDLTPAHKYRKKSPLSLESMESLGMALKSIDAQKEILREGQKKSFMDETNIKE